MIPCKKVNYPECYMRYIDLPNHLSIQPPLYQAHTWTRIFVFKCNDGMWHYYIDNEERKLSSGYFQKRQVIEALEKIEQPKVTWTGKAKISVSHDAKINKIKYASRTVELTGHTNEHWENYTNNFIDILVGHAKSFYEVDLSNLIRTISFANSWKTGKSFAGIRRNGPKVFIRLGRRMQVNFEGVYYFGEYNHISSDPNIGSISGKSFEDVIKVLCIHEIAHSIRQKLRIDNMQFFQIIDPTLLRPCFSFENRKVYKDTSKKNDGDHAAVWQSIYCEMRKKFLPEYSGVN